MSEPIRRRGRMGWAAYLPHVGLSLLALVALLVSGAALSVSRSPVAGGDIDGQVSLMEPPRTAFVGDSYTQGVGASSPASRWVTLVALEEGWEPENLGRGGTGYVTSAGADGCGIDYCPTYLEMVPQVVSSSPDVVVVAGGQNDLTAFETDPEAVTGQILATYIALREGLPEAEVIAVGPSTPQEPGEGALALDAAVKDAAAIVGARYISLIAPNVIDPEFVLPDRAHVDDLGHAAIAARVEEGLRS